MKSRQEVIEALKDAAVLDLQLDEYYELAKSMGWWVCKLEGDEPALAPIH